MWTKSREREKEIEGKCGRNRGKVWKKLRESVEESEESEEEIKVKWKRHRGKVRNKLRQNVEEIEGK